MKLATAAIWFFGILTCALVGDLIALVIVGVQAQ